MKLPLIAGLVVGGVSTLAVIIAVAVAPQPTHEEPHRPMPCAEDEVYEWSDYPADAECVSGLGHASRLLPEAPPAEPVPFTTTSTTLSAYAAVHACEQHVREHGGRAPVEGYGIWCEVDADGNVVAVP